MIKNIPNKYDQDMLLEAVDKNFKGKYDFLYLPIDLKVISGNKCFNKIRINVMWDMPLSISLTLNPFLISTGSSMAKSGRNSRVKKSAILNTPGFKALIRFCNTSRIPTL